jgi:hypothetical protein
LVLFFWVGGVWGHGGRHKGLVDGGLRCANPPYVFYLLFGAVEKTAPAD